LSTPRDLGDRGQPWRLKYSLRRIPEVSDLADFPLSFEDWEEIARKNLSKERFAYVSAGAGRGESVIENNEELRKWKLVPRVLRDTSGRTTSTEVLGARLAVPMMLAPVRGLAYVRDKGEEICARAGARCEVPLILSNLASATPETVAKLMGKTPYFFQLYPCTDNEVIDSLIHRAELSGYRGVFMTVDMSGHAIQYSGPRTTEYEQYGNEVYLSDPVFLSRLKQSPSRDSRAALEMIRQLRRAQFTWQDVKRVSTLTRLPIVLKGILRQYDAKEAIEHGVSGIVVSNHGGRSLDGAVSSIDMLPAIREAVGGRTAVFFDGGIRSGSDVLRALALGADAVLIGRAYVYALAAAGEDGVVSMLRTTIREIDSALASCGCSSVRELNESFLRRA
jgi:lactate 2-monooxygenase